MDAIGDSPREFKTEAVASQVLYPEHESCSTDFLNTHKSGKGKYYAVRHGYCPGVYLSWSECRFQVDGFRGADHKRFKTYQEAESYVGATASNIHSNAPQSRVRRKLP